MTELESDTLAGLWSLRRLDLDRNLISELHKHSFRNLTIRPNGESCWVLVRGCGRGQLFYATVGGCGSTVQFLNDRAFDGLHNLLGLSLVEGFGVTVRKRTAILRYSWGFRMHPQCSETSSSYDRCTSQIIAYRSVTASTVPLYSVAYVRK